MNNKKNNLTEMSPVPFSNNNRLYDLYNNIYNESNYYNKNVKNINIINKNNKTTIENHSLNKSKGFGYKQNNNLKKKFEAINKDKYHMEFYSMNFGDLKSKRKNMKNLLNSIKEINLNDIKYGQFITIGNRVFYSVEDI